MSKKTYFLGANTPTGFHSLFSELYNPENDNTIYLIKGGPGTGKSSIMKKVAAKAEKSGFKVDYIPCSSDPLSLDAIIIPELNVSLADATSPHIINPVYPGVCEHTVDLSSCWNSEKLKANGNEIKRITSENSKWHKNCIKYLRTAALIDKEIKDTLLNITDFVKVKRFIIRFLNTYKSIFEQGKIKKCFLSAVTPIGITIEYDTIAECNKIIAINDKYSVVSEIIMKSIEDYIVNNNYGATLCLCPLNPSNKTEHIIFGDELTLFTANSYHPMISKPYKTINAERFYKKEEYNAVKNKLTFLLKAKTELIGEAVSCLKQAKLTHDLLESYYIAAMDFFKVSEITDDIISKIFK